jgi:polysaccharide export outer membrane protein
MKSLSIFLSSAIFALGLSSAAVAQNIDPAMLAKFQQLPKSQQQALAKQYGIDLNSITNGGTNSRTPLAQIGEPLTQRSLDNDLSLSQGLSPFDGMFNNEQINEDEDELQRYGMQLFDQNVSTFAPTDNAQVPNDYRLGIGDELVVQYIGKESDELILEVNRDGQIQLPRLGHLSIAGMLFTEASSLIQDRVSNGLIGVKAVVSMGRLRVINVFMAGEVKVPGAYSVSALTTISQALFQAGGISDIGTLRDVQVKRQGKVVASFDVYDLLLSGNSTNDVRLRSGDVVFVPTYTALVEVSGEVKRPMLYELTSTETITDALSMAGGLKSNALDSTIILTKRSETNDLPEVKNISLLNNDESDVVLSDGDRIVAQSLSNALTNSVSIEGAVVRSGDFGWYEGIRVSDLITDIRRDLETTADLEYAIIVREKNARLDIEIVQFSLIDALLNSGTDADPILNMHDKIMVFDNVSTTAFDQEKSEERSSKPMNDVNLKGDDETSFAARFNEAQKNRRQMQNDVEAFEENESQKTYSKNSREILLVPIIDKLKSQAREGSPVQLASISGAVKSPGQYPINTNFTANDLVKAAGGFKDSAFLRSVELRRITETDSGAINASYQQYNLSAPDTLSDLTILSRDNLNVRENADWSPEDTIEITGEVKFPGTYLISEGETLRDVLLRAGGLDDNAFADAAVFTRETIAELEAQRAKEFAQTVRRDYASSVLTEEENSATFEEVYAITQQLEEFKGQGRLLIDLNSAIAGEVDANITLVDGDKLHVPKRSSTVTIVGEVRRQGSHSFQQALDLDDYITLGAGMTKRADDAGIYIVKANGSVVIPNTSLTSFNQSNTQLQPGDTIVVPVNAQYKDSVPFWRDVTQIIYQGTVAIAAIAAL